MLADETDFVIGVDPHRDAHALAALEARTSATLATRTVAAGARGHGEALAFAGEVAPGRRVWAIEGTGSYGAGLARFLAARGERVFEVARLPREGRRSRAKSDVLDAARAARSVLGEFEPARPRAGGPREALRALMVAREGALAGRRRALCQLRSLLVTGPEELRARLLDLSRARLLRACAALRPARRRDKAAAGVARALCSLAHRILALDREERMLKREIELLVAELAPTLLAEPGVGPVSAAQLLLSWSHRGRIRSEAAFARLAAAAPIPASSGKTVRHRLDPGGDRRLNRALHTIVVARRKHHAPTIAYCARRVREGKSIRETIRCLKRYLARHFFRLLERMPVTA